MLNVRIDRTRCIGAGNCIHIAPTAFDWLKGDHGKADVVDIGSVEEELLREAVIACPTHAIEVETVEELLPWQLRQRSRVTRRVVKTFMFTDIVGSTNLLELLGDEAWHDLLRWHDETLRGLFGSFQGEEVVATGDGFFVGFDTPDDAIACAVAVQRTLLEHRQKHGFAPQVRVGVHASGATQVGRNFQGMGVHLRVAHRCAGGRQPDPGQPRHRGRRPLRGQRAAHRHAQGHLRAGGGGVRHLAVSLQPRASDATAEYDRRRSGTPKGPWGPARCRMRMTHASQPVHRRCRALGPRGRACHPGEFARTHPATGGMPRVVAAATPYGSSWKISVTSAPWANTIHSTSFIG